ncbi:uncharacterized protein LOC133378809 [Rhineura floridana]|uniref:uncharacterized protein LOC133378809 n=1 Tax=Rhineura floridana TaxID=261503 RepID=UPI002AC806C8|nr:uncharacterized protein LOC133378809 [Rhineura floridana]
MYCSVYVDDILYVLHKEKDEISLHNSLKQHVDTKCLEPVTHYLGTDTIRSEDGSFMLRQEEKIKQMLDICGMSECKPVSTPMTVSFQQETNKIPCTNPDLYRHIMGKLQYLVKVTCPDICNAVSFLSRKVETPTEHDWQGVKRVLRYLKGTSKKGLVMSGQGKGGMECYVDADHASELTSRKSTTGIVILLHGSVIDWCSRRQAVVAISSSEAEYVSLSTTCNKLQWFEHLTQELCIEVKKPILVYEDNQTCIRLAMSEANTKRTKHISVRYHHIRECIQQGFITLSYCNTNNMLANVMTKPICEEKYNRMVIKLGMY